jgi:hypothetical protein
MLPWLVLLCPLDAFLRKTIGRKTTCRDPETGSWERSDQQERQLYSFGDFPWGRHVAFPFNNYRIIFLFLCCSVSGGRDSQKDMLKYRHTKVNKWLFQRYWDAKPRSLWINRVIIASSSSNKVCIRPVAPSPPPTLSPTQIVTVQQMAISDKNKLYSNVANENLNFQVSKHRKCVTLISKCKLSWVRKKYF